jgi:Zn-finger nucleic acid-binding protein
MQMAADASSLHCPNCGAPADPAARRCRYCEARLATVSCPSCFALIFDGAAFCPRCGARRARAEQDGVGLACPGCREAMRRLDVGSTSMLECGSCDGVWVDAEIFESLCADREAQAAVIHRFEKSAPPAAERVRYRPCPRCAKMMNRVNFGRLSGTVVDVCKGHGTFLDPGELHSIVRFIQGGGLERARARQLEELKEQERRVRDAEARAARERGRSDPQRSVSLETWTFMVGGADGD